MSLPLFFSFSPTQMNFFPPPPIFIKDGPKLKV